MRIKAEALHSVPVTDDNSFIRRFEALTKVLVPCAEEIFGRTSRYKKGHAVTSPKLQAIVASIRSIGGATRHVKSDYTVPVSFAAMKTLNYHAAEYSHLSVVSLPSFREYLVSKRRSLNKELYAEKMAEIFSRAKLQDRNRMIAALRGGSTKKLVATCGFISLPQSISACNNPDTLLSDPETVMEETREYFSTLYGCLPPVSVPKPWLTTPSVLMVRERVQAEPFEWPRPASIARFRALLRKGNQRPSPGLTNGRSGV